jgi:ATP-dependent Lon protease
MIVINVSGYNNEEKIVLAQEYIVPELLIQYNLNKGDIIFTTELIKHIINSIEKEEGVRNLKRAINNILSWINMMIYVPIDSVEISLPYAISIPFYDKYCKKNTPVSNSANMLSLYL